MSPVAAGLDGLLALLLVAALMLGVRLNARLKTLRDSQAGFAAAVIELNKAAARAEAGLAALKTAQEDAHEDLLGRIEVARGLVTKLERAGAEAERRAAFAPERSFDPSPRAASRPADGPPSGGALAAIAALAEGRGGSRAAPSSDPARGRLGSEAEGVGPAPVVPPSRRAPVRGAFDEDLFAAPVTRRDGPLSLGALDRIAADRASTQAPPRPAQPAISRTETQTADDTLDLGPLPDPLSKWKTVR